MDSFEKLYSVLFILFFVSVPLNAIYSKLEVIAKLLKEKSE